MSNLIYISLSIKDILAVSWNWTKHSVFLDVYRSWRVPLSHHARDSLSRSTT